MSNQPPTLGEMISHLEETTKSQSTADLIAVEDVKYVLEHFGIKGMKWGIRRSDRELAALKAENTGKSPARILGKTLTDAYRIRKMKPGEAVVLDNDDGLGPKTFVKQKNGTLKIAFISADAEKMLNTLEKDPIERSTREMKEAVARAQAIEAYNKIFQPVVDPNAHLRQQAETYELKARYAKAHAAMNPSRTARVANFVGEMKPVFSFFESADKVLGGTLTKSLTDMASALKSQPDNDTTAKPAKTTTTSVPKSSRKSSTPFQPDENPDFQKRSTNAPDPVWDVTSFNKDGQDFGNPFIPELEPRRKR